MLKYLLKRIFQMFVVLFVVSVIVFCVMSFTGDPVLMIVPPTATDAQIAEAAATEATATPREMRRP